MGSSPLSDSQRRTGILEIVLSGCFFGTLGVFGKQVYRLGVSPGELLSLRFLLAGLFLALILGFKNPKSLLISVRTLLSCAFLGITGYAVFSYCFFLALDRLSSSLTYLLLYLYPVIVASAAWLLYQEPIPKSRWMALPSVMLGLFLLVWGQFEVHQMSGLFYGVGSAVFYSVYILASKRLLRGIPHWVALTYILAFAGITQGLIHLQSLERLNELIRIAWAPLSGIVLISTVGAMSLFLAGLQKLKGWEVSVLSMSEPVTGVLLAILLLGERLAWTQILGGVMIFGALVFVSLPQKKNLLAASIERSLEAP